MHTMQAKKFPHLPLLVGGTAAILAGGIAISLLAISAQGFSGAVAPAEAAAAAPTGAAGAARSSYRCAECGVIESTQWIDVSDEDSAAREPGRMTAGKRGEATPMLLRNHKITIRLRDGSMRVITDAKPAKWRHGEPVTVIAGVD